MMSMLIPFTFMCFFTIVNSQTCPTNHYLDITSQTCTPCRECEEDQTLRTCSGSNDTLCGTVNFLFPGTISETGQRDNKQKTEEIITPFELSHEEEKSWKQLAIIMIIALSVLIVVSTFLMVGLFYRFRRSGWFCKNVNQDQDDLENGYVVIHKLGTRTVLPQVASGSQQHTVILPEHQALVSKPGKYKKSSRQKYTPKRRLMNEYVDDVFESDDSGGSRTLRLPLATIPERNEAT